MIAAMNVFAADSDAAAHELFAQVLRERVRRFVRRGVVLDDDGADAVLASPAGEQVRQMMRVSAVGSPAVVREQVGAFVARTDADEVIVASGVSDPAARLRSYELLAQAWGLAG